MAGLTPRKEEAHEDTQPFKQASVATRNDSTFTLVVESKEVIDHQAWNDKQAEGEGYQCWLR
jgi:hypothetical protein